MANPLKKIKRWFENYGRMLGITVVILVVISVGIWHATSTDGVVVQEDFGDARISEVAQEISNLSYEDALLLWNEGDEAKARAVMQRLAPLQVANATAVGNGLAHLWVAKDLLSAEDFGFLEGFPLDAYGAAGLEPPVQLEQNELLSKAERHLEAAVELDAVRAEAALMLAEYRLASGERNEAVLLLLESIAQNEGAQVDLGVNLANARCYKGDDLALEEAGWHRFATLGKEVIGRGRSDLNVRLDYLFTGMLLGEFEAVERSLKSFERDFAERVEVVKSVKASEAYFKAVDLLNGEELKGDEIVEQVLMAQRFQPGRKAFTEALELLVERFPEFKDRVGEFIFTTIEDVEDGDVRADLYLQLAEWVPGRESEFIEAAVEAAPDRPSLVVMRLRNELEEGSEEYAQMNQALEGLEQKSLEVQLLRAEIAIKQGEPEKCIEVLVGEVGKVGDVLAKREVHRILAEAYRACGEDILADDHLQLSQE
ncbi:hypothetical protein ACFPK9_08545 [Rubritalea spongiae]|uniref:Tetratricopeptide repeat protein n=1 Tax=Rubritalea spongiae TaxID=430797 RepID=A0ABW5E0Z7_9BACT